MRFVPLAIDGAFAVVPEPIEDERGAFARVFCTREFAAAGLVATFAQSSVSMNRKAGTLRGMHYSVGPQAETKLVRCTAGAILDVLVDVRIGAASFGASLTYELCADTRIALYVPSGVAHGFQTLHDDSEVLYMIDEPFVAGTGRGLRWNDPIVQATWPLPIAAISERDRTYPDFASPTDDLGPASASAS